LSRLLSNKILVIALTALILAAVVSLSIIFFFQSESTIVVRKLPDSASLATSFEQQLLQVSASASALQNPVLSTETQSVLAKIDGTVFEPNKVFSFSDWYQSSGLSINDSTKSLVASLVYEASVRLGMEIGERYTHLSLPTYIKPGFDVEIVNNSKDLTLRNPYLFSLKLVKNNKVGNLGFSLYTNFAKDVTLPQITYESQIIPFKKVLLSKERATGLDAKYSTSGTNGLLFKVFSNHACKSKELISRDYYPAKPQFILKSGENVTPTEDTIAEQ